MLDKINFWPKFLKFKVLLRNIFDLIPIASREIKIRYDGSNMPGARDVSDTTARVRGCASVALQSDNVDQREA